MSIANAALFALPSHLRVLVLEQAYFLRL
jgi:hypothetical protein